MQPAPAEDDDLHVATEKLKIGMQRQKRAWPHELDKLSLLPKCLPAFTETQNLLQRLRVCRDSIN